MCRRRNSSRGLASVSSEPGAEREQPLAIARDVTALSRALGEQPEGSPSRTFSSPPRMAARRPPGADRRRHPYSEIRDNLIDAAMRPIDLLRSKLAFFGASVRPALGSLAAHLAVAGEPFPDEIAREGEPSHDRAFAERSGVARRRSRPRRRLFWGLAEESGAARVAWRRAAFPGRSRFALAEKPGVAGALVGERDVARAPTRNGRDGALCPIARRAADRRSCDPARRALASRQRRRSYLARGMLAASNAVDVRVAWPAASAWVGRQDVFPRRQATPG